MIFLLASRGARLKVHQVAEQFLGSLPPVFHHENDALLLLFREGDACLGQHALHFLLRRRKRVSCRRQRTLRRRRRLLGNQRTGERHDEHDHSFHESASVIYSVLRL